MTQAHTAKGKPKGPKDPEHRKTCFMCYMTYAIAEFQKNHPKPETLQQSEEISKVLTASIALTIDVADELGDAFKREGSEGYDRWGTLFLNLAKQIHERYVGSLFHGLSDILEAASATKQ